MPARGDAQDSRGFFLGDLGFGAGLAEPAAHRRVIGYCHRMDSEPVGVIPRLWHVMDVAGGSEAALRSVCERMTSEQLIVLRRVFGEVVDALVARLDRFPMAVPAPKQASRFAEVAAEVYRERFGTEVTESQPVPHPVGARLAWELRVWADFDLSQWMGGEGASLERICRGLTCEQLVLFHRRCAGAPDGSAAGWRALACFAVTCGKRVWYEAKRNPASLPAAPADGRDFERVMAEVYRERFGHDIPLLEPEPTGVDGDPRYEAEVWELADAVSVGVPLAELLPARTRSELVNLDAALLRVVADLAERAEAVFGEDRAGLGWSQWADWMVGQGRDACEYQLAHPDEVVRDVPGDAWYLDSQLCDFYQARYGKLPYTLRTP
jgi:hypothetical protein